MTQQSPEAAPDAHAPEFGFEPGRAYIERPSAYVVLRDDEGRVAVVRAPHGVHLPGGGQHTDEDPAQTALRETHEECGLSIRIDDRIGFATEFVSAPDENASFAKRSTFFRAHILARGVPAEPDHELLWLPPAAAQRSLTPESHRWAVARTLNVADPSCPDSQSSE